MGKTLFTGLLLRHLRSNGIDAVALKPFCSGSRDDVEFLQSFQRGILPNDVVNPVYISKPIAPYVELRRKKTKPRSIVETIKALDHEVVLIEGSGGVMVPLMTDYLVLDFLKDLKAQVVLVGRNQLGTLNHTLLSVHALKPLKPAIVLMEPKKADHSSATNLQVLRDFLPGLKIFSFPFLGKKVSNKNRSAEKVFEQVYRI